ncbi:MAG TPA: hypothetical protein VFR44_06645 [Actinomycetota bacterium]|nr:hypothetical protein [Actinomycetota bacterium]
MRWGALEVENHRGVLVPRILWALVDGLALVWAIGYSLVREPGRGAWGALAGVLLVSAAGLIDDLTPIGPRGLRGHARSLLEGHMTTGVLKVLVTIGSAVVVIALQGERSAWVMAAGIVLVAGCTNVWNGLDVAPGRSFKAFLPAILVFLIAGDLEVFPAALGMFLAALAALPLDLRERAMLGDAGSNPLGFAAGLGLYATFDGAWVAVAAAAAVILNVLAETVTLSRLIGRAPPLRWLDRVGRVAGDR